MKENWKMTTIMTGGILGALVGLLAAYLLVQRAEKQQTRPKLDPGDGVKVGLGVLTLLKLIVDSGTD